LQNLKFLHSEYDFLLALKRAFQVALRVTPPLSRNPLDPWTRARRGRSTVSTTWRTPGPAISRKYSRSGKYRNSRTSSTGSTKMTSIRWAQRMGFFAGLVLLSRYIRDLTTLASTIMKTVKSSKYYWFNYSLVILYFF
jgi:hypothetical protein